MKDEKSILASYAKKIIETREQMDDSMYHLALMLIPKDINHISSRFISDHKSRKSYSECYDNTEKATALILGYDEVEYHSQRRHRRAL